MDPQQWSHVHYCDGHHSCPDYDDQNHLKDHRACDEYHHSIDSDFGSNK